MNAASFVSLSQRKAHMNSIIHDLRMAYTCRGCGAQVSYPSTFKKCPVCGIKWG